MLTKHESAVVALVRRLRLFPPPHAGVDPYVSKYPSRRYVPKTIITSPTYRNPIYSIFGSLGPLGDVCLPTDSPVWKSTAS